MKNAPAYVKVYSRLKNEINKGTYPVGGFLRRSVNWRKSIRRSYVENLWIMWVSTWIIC